MSQRGTAQNKKREEKEEMKKGGGAGEEEGGQSVEEEEEEEEERQHCEMEADPTLGQLRLGMGSVRGHGFQSQRSVDTQRSSRRSRDTRLEACGAWAHT